MFLLVATRKLLKAEVRYFMNELAVKDLSTEVTKGRKLEGPFKSRAYRCEKVADCVNLCHDEVHLVSFMLLPSTIFL
jgi:hypothetical protein